jgi:sugar phosphate isomerase/epimerase
MRIAISNIAWDVSEDAQIAILLKKYLVDAIDIAPGKYFPDPSNASDESIAQVKRWWEDQGIEITGMQALLFGTVGLNLFGASDARKRMLTHLTHVCRIAAKLDAKYLVFGSPKNRDRTGLDERQVEQVAMPFFSSLGHIAADLGVTICLEPNPPVYGANFMTNSAETSHVVRLVNHPNIQMQFDTGAITINGEDPEQLIMEHAPIIKHVHVSEPQLMTIGRAETNHALIGSALNKNLDQCIATIEMVATKEEAHVLTVEEALRYTVQCYRPSPMVTP